MTHLMNTDKDDFLRLLEFESEEEDESQIYILRQSQLNELKAFNRKQELAQFIKIDDYLNEKDVDDNTQRCQIDSSYFQQNLIKIDHKNLSKEMKKAILELNIEDQESILSKDIGQFQHFTINTQEQVLQFLFAKFREIIKHNWRNDLQLDYQNIIDELKQRFHLKIENADTVFNIDNMGMLDNDEFLDILSSSIKDYRYKLDDQYQLRKSGQEQQQVPRYSLMLQQEKEEEQQMKRILRRVADLEENDNQVRFRDENMENDDDDNQSYVYSQISGSQQQSQQTNKDRQSFDKVKTLKDLFQQQKQKYQQSGNVIKISKRKRDQSNNPPREKPRQRNLLDYGQRSKAKLVQSYTGQIIQKEKKKNNWGKIVDYFPDSQTTALTLERSIYSGSSNQLNNNKKPENQQIARLDSLFYKKQTQQSTLQESQFKRQEFQIRVDELFKRLNQFDLKSFIHKFKEDNHFKSYINQQVLKIQQYIGKNQLPYDDEDTIYFNEENYQKNDEESILKALKNYCTTLSNFDSFTPYQKQDLITKINSCFINLIFNLNIFEFMMIKSFEYQTTVIMQLILIIDLLNQEQGKMIVDYELFLQYIVLYVIKILMSLNQEQARGLLKKETLIIQFKLQHSNNGRANQN
ncbi:UNKNOWN [Stylonychia lemnae]|uniref:Uncharacterized protein n=1 Tax=Stylonychia lemnae TaxID=5949 RepID=A0A078AEP2_STYLE|nr:UNKNOWN [Stylonychia lemnae]|eukprot:CDW80739.1 UNKNOWN [Stylonychia lemnae]